MSCKLLSWTQDIIFKLLGQNKSSASDISMVRRLFWPNTSKKPPNDTSTILPKFI